MPVFSYQAQTDGGQSVRGTISEPSPRQARNVLRQRGFSVLSLEEVSAPGGVDPVGLGGASASQVAAFTGELATLLAVGVPLLEALATLARQYRGRFRTRLLTIHDDVASGISLADALARHRRVFDELCVSLVEVGENTGHLDQSLENISRFKRRSSEFRDRVFSALLYPFIVLSACLGVSIFLMTVVVPMLLSNLEELGKTLPWPTRFLKSVSDFLISNGGLMALAAIVILALLVGFAQTASGGRWRDRLIWMLPVIGTMSRKQEISRVALIVSTLLASGLDFLKAIEIASRSSRSALLRDALETIAQRVRAGKELGPVLARLDYFPPLVAQVFTIGQKSGRLESMLQRLGEDYDAQVTSTSQKLSTIIEPVLIVILAAVVGFILLATLLPILEAGNVL